MTKETESDRFPATIRLPRSLHLTIKSEAALKGLSLSDYVVQILEGRNGPSSRFTDSQPRKA